MVPTLTDTYCGRFAPSPTGPLHLGSLIAALASWLDARSAGGQWLLRIDDIDPPREQPGAASAIIHSLQQHQLRWDGDILWQSHRSTAYEAALAALHAGGHLFACSCSRRELGPDGVCVRDCRHRERPDGMPSALRVAVPADFESQWQDPWQGTQRWPLGQQLTDFVVRRKDGLYAYQLAVVVDDALQGITHVVRGEDLADNTPRQLLLQHALGAPHPQYLHTPLVRMPDGEKLSKQHGAPAVELHQPLQALNAAAQVLQLPAANPETTVADALAQWVEIWRSTYNAQRD